MKFTLTIKNTCVIAYHNSKCVKLWKLNIWVYYDNSEHICGCLSWSYVSNCLCWDILSPTFGCFIIVITKVHTGIVIVLSMIIILGRMLRLLKEINYILWTVLIFFCPFGNKISAYWLWYLINCPYCCGSSKFQAIARLRNSGI